MPPLTQLWASLADLEEMGPTFEALASLSAKKKLAALRAASAEVALYARSRYSMPLAITLEEIDADAIAPGAVLVSGTAEEALALGVRADAPGGVAGAGLPVTWGHVAWDDDDAVVFLTEKATTLSAGGNLAIGGLTLTFSGALPADGVVTVRAGIDHAIRQHVVNVAAYNLLWNRGVDPESEAGRELARRHDRAVALAKDLQSEIGKLDETKDATPGVRETRPRGGGQKNPWDWLDEQ